MPSFSQRNMFDVLDIEDGPDYEEVVEVYVYCTRATLTNRIPEETQPVASEPAPVSKSAKKRAARTARLAAEAEKKAVTANGKSSNDDAQPAASPAQEDAKPKSQPAAVKAATKGASPDNTAKEAPAAAASSKVDQTPAASRNDAKVASSKSSPPTSSFKPDLPADLPTRTAEELPANRKRKTPVDFSPSGPGSALTPTSPSKNSVKFEDGIIPGEGAEGEKTITPRSDKPAAEILAPTAPPKKQNFIERTVWTFIMIFGFIGKRCGLGAEAYHQLSCAWVTLT